MIDYIIGTVVDITSTYIVVENNKIGYQIFCANPFVFQEFIDQETKVYTYQYVREDLIALYGFLSKPERGLFIKLISVSGIGPKGALAILASGRPDLVIAAIEQENEKYLVKFPGIGKKTARQIILDLKGKFKEQQQQFGPDQVHDVTPSSSINQNLEEAIEALKALGYTEKEIQKVTPQLNQEGQTSEQYIKEALRLMLLG